MIKEQNSETATQIFDAQTFWLDCNNASSLDEDVKAFAQTVCRVFGLVPAALDVGKYASIVQAKNFLELLASSAAPEDSAAVESYLSAAPSNLKFYISHSVLCLAGRLQAANSLRLTAKASRGRGISEINGSNAASSTD